MKKIPLVTMSALFMFAQMSAPFAQVPPTATPVDPATTAAVPAAPAPVPPFTGSFLFSPLEMTAVLSTMSGKSISNSMLNTQNVGNIPLKRVISLAGVVYNNPGDWIIWLNGQKMIPGQMLPEIMDIRVSRDIVHLQWFDIGMNKVIKISLRPHQTYDIVTGLLLPG